MKYVFGDIVVVDGIYIGVIVKTWIDEDDDYIYEVYVRGYNRIEEYEEDNIQRYMVRHKYLSEEELEHQHNAVNGL